MQLLTTKLTLPPTRQQLVARPNLQGKLAYAKGHILISAPAGYGKTTVVADWVRNGVVAWLSLDGEDNGLAHFLHYVVGAHRVLWAGFGEATLTMLQHDSPVSVTRLLTPFVNEIAGILSHNPMPTPIRFILDDYHQIHNPLIHEAVSFLLHHAPTQWQMVLISRHDPPFALTRLQSQGRLLVVGENDLRFSAQETAAFWEADLSEKETLQLQAQTEGWVTGLQLLKISGINPANLVTPPRLFAYLAEEVFVCQSSDLQAFLLASSVPERFTVALVGVMLGIGEEECRHFLQTTQQKNLFLIPLDPTGTWYRYHHLFRDFLRRQNAGKTIWQQRAAHWFAQQNLPYEAIHHALAGNNITLATAWIESEAMSAWLAGDRPTLRHWLAQISESELATRPQLCLFKAWLLTVEGAYVQAEQWLKVANSQEMADDNLADMQAVLSQFLRYQHNPNPAQMVHDAQRLLHHLKTDAPAWRTIALLTLGSSAQETGAKVVAEQALQEALAESQRAKSDYLQFLAYHNLILLNLQYGHLQQAEVLCRHFLHLAAHTPQKLLYHTLAHQYLGSIYLYRDEREQANAELQAGLQLSRDIHFRTAEMNILLRLVWLAITTGDLSTATAYSAELQQGRSRHEDKASSAFAAGHRAFLGSKLGDFGAVNHWLRQTDLQPEQFANEFSFNQFSDYVTWMHAQMAMGKGGAKQVLRMMAQLKPYIYQRHNPQLSIEFGVFAACASFVLGDKEGALDSFAEAAALAEPEGYTFPFLLMGGKMPALINLAAQVNISPEFTQKLQNALQKNNQLNPLTPRENELLGLVSAGMSNEAIAQQTHVSINTVKAHLKRIHVKLNVKNRTSAVAEGKRLGII